MRMTFLIVAAAAAVAAPPHKLALAEEVGLVFKTAEGTGLPEIFAGRRAELIERRGGKLTSHDWWIWGLGAFDYDLDGDLDLIVCIHGPNNGMILKNQQVETGTLVFVDATKALGADGLVPGTDDYPAVWDFDGDGDLDVAGVLDDSPRPCLINEKGNRFTEAPFRIHPVNHPTGVRDLNGDGYLDIYQDYSNARREGTRLSFVYDPKNKTFKRVASTLDRPTNLPKAVTAEIQASRKMVNGRPQGLYPSYVVEHDLNGDGRKDLVLKSFAAYGGGPCAGRYLIATEGGGWQDRTMAMGLPKAGTPFFFQDVDQDGDVDVLIAADKTGGLFLNDGSGRFARKDGPLTEFVMRRYPYLHRAFPVDLDNDGDLDLVVSSRRHGQERVFENRGGGEFALALAVSGGWVDPIVLCDMDDDGRMDVLIGCTGKDKIGTVAVYLNRTPAAGNYCRLHPRMAKPNPYAVGSELQVFRAGGLDDDGRVPILIEHAHPNATPIHVGLGKATHFDLSVTFPGGVERRWKRVRAAPHLRVTPDAEPAALEANPLVGRGARPAARVERLQGASNAQADHSYSRVRLGRAGSGRGESAGAGG
jgi:hypothetical protein